MSQPLRQLREQAIQWQKFIQQDVKTGLYFKIQSRKDQTWKCLLSKQKVIFLKYAKVKCEYLNIRWLSVKWVMISTLSKDQFRIVKWKKAENHFVAVTVQLLAILLPHLHKMYTEYHANHTPIFLTSKAHEPLRTVRHNGLNSPWTWGSTRWRRVTPIYTCVYIYIYKYISIYPFPSSCKSKLTQTPGMKVKTHMGQILTADFKTKYVSHFRTMFARQLVTRHSEWNIIDKISGVIRHHEFSALPRTQYL